MINLKKGTCSLLFCALILCTSVANAECQNYPPALQAMPKGEDVLINPDGREINIQYRLAETSSLRAAGFQHVCPATITKENILFVFQTEFISAFHMNNVYAALDIAFFDKEGVIIDIQTMHPYSLISIKKPRYRPASAAMYALETRRGYFVEAGVNVGARLKSKSTHSIK